MENEIIDFSILFSLYKIRRTFFLLNAAFAFAFVAFAVCGVCGFFGLRILRFANFVACGVCSLRFAAIAVSGVCGGCGSQGLRIAVVGVRGLRFAAVAVCGGGGFRGLFRPSAKLSQIMTVSKFVHYSNLFFKVCALRENLSYR